jgi:Cu/Zn superoxide dismutase
MRLLLLCLAPLLAVAQVAKVTTFSRYPGYTGLDITGTVTISDAAPGYTFDAVLVGGASLVDHAVHIHSGVSCAAGDIGGHFWTPFLDPDPWKVPIITANINGDITGSFDVDFGFTEQHFIGHAMVVHSNGTAVACGIIKPFPIAPPIAYETAVMTTYPGYVGLNVGGKVEIWDLDATTQVVNFRLVGLGVNKTGGIYIHEGKTCLGSGLTFWTNLVSADPWGVGTTYTSNANGVAEGSFIIVSGYALSDHLHRAVVVHDEGALSENIACGALGGLLVATVPSLGAYPGYGGGKVFAGTIEISYEPTRPGTYRFDVNLAGVPASAAVGFHVHAGVSCVAPSAVGGHFWAPFNATDPWATTKVTADAFGFVKTRFDINFGYDHEQFVGHAIVIHDDVVPSTRVSCGLIEDPVSGLPRYEEAVLTLYPGYLGTRTATGTVQVRDLPGNRQVVNFRVSGVGANVTGGVHIHEGLTCVNSSIHYWTPSASMDPWTTTYLANYMGIAEGSFIISSGYQLNGNIHHAVVIHDGDVAKTKIACGLLGGPAPTGAPTFAPTTTPTPGPNCPSTSMQGTFAACKVYDFSGTSQCSAACSASLQTLINAFKAQNATLSGAIACLDTANTATPWTNGDLPTLKQRLNFNDVPLCNVTGTTSVNGAVAVSHVVAAIVPFFLLC